MINNLIECHKSELCLRQISKCDKKQQQQDCRTPCPGVYHITCGSKYCARNKLSCSKFQVEKVFSTISNTSTILNCPLLTVQNNLKSTHLQYIHSQNNTIKKNLCYAYITDRIFIYYI